VNKYLKDLAEAADDKKDFYHVTVRPTNNPLAIKSSKELFTEAMNNNDHQFWRKDNE